MWKVSWSIQIWIILNDCDGVNVDLYIYSAHRVYGIRYITYGCLSGPVQLAGDTSMIEIVLPALAKFDV